MRLLPQLRRREEDNPLSMAEVSIQPQVSDFWSSLWSNGTVPEMPWSSRLVDRVWVVNRCLQLNSQVVKAMPLRFHSLGSRPEPKWVSNPDPVWFPNGIETALQAVAWHMYAHGDAFLYITSRYVDGYPSAWTVLDPTSMNVKVDGGRRQYRSKNVELDPDDVVQITRDSRGQVRGTSALASYASLTWGLVGASELGRTMHSAGGGVPNAILRSKRKLGAEQAAALQNQWVAARQRSAVGVPAVLPPEIDFEQLSFSPADLALLELQEFDAKAIATAFGVPAPMLNMTLEGGLTYANPEMLYEIWWRSELHPFSQTIERALSQRLLPAGNWVKFDPSEVLAPTWPNQVSSVVELHKEGIMTVDEARARLGLRPLAEGEMTAELLTPPTASGSPTQAAPGVVQELRPTAVMT